MSARSVIPKRFAAPVGYTLADEPEDVKALRMLRGLRHFAHGKSGCLGVTIDGVQIMLVKYEPKPYGRHPADADLSGVEA